MLRRFLLCPFPAPPPHQSLLTPQSQVRNLFQTPRFWSGDSSLCSPTASRIFTVLAWILGSPGGRPLLQPLPRCSPGPSTSTGLEVLHKCKAKQTRLGRAAGLAPSPGNTQPGPVCLWTLSLKAREAGGASESQQNRRDNVQEVQRISGWKMSREEEAVPQCPQKAHLRSQAITPRMPAKLRTWRAQAPQEQRVNQRTKHRDLAENLNSKQ